MLENAEMIRLFDDEAGVYYPSYMLMKMDSSINFDNFERNRVLHWFPICWADKKGLSH